MSQYPIPPAYFLKQPEKVGKAQKRYFVFNGKEVIYAVGVNSANGQLQSEKGRISINQKAAVSVKGADLEIKAGDRVYKLTAESPAVASAWHAVLSDAITKATGPGGRIVSVSPSTTRKTISSPSSPAGTRKSTLSPSSSKPSTLPEVPEGEWFYKKPEKVGKDQKRFMVIEGPEIKYYADFRDQKPAALKGSIQLLNSTTVKADGKQLSIINSKRTWVLIAPSIQVALKWSRYLTAYVPTIGHAEELVAQPDDDLETSELVDSETHASTDAVSINSVPASDVALPQPPVQHIENGSLNGNGHHVIDQINCVPTNPEPISVELKDDSESSHFDNKPDDKSPSSGPDLVISSPEHQAHSPAVSRDSPPLPNDAPPLPDDAPPTESEAENGSVMYKALKSISLEQYDEMLEDNGFDDVELLKELTDDDLLEIGIEDADHRAQILRLTMEMEMPSKTVPEDSEPSRELNIRIESTLDATTPELNKDQPKLSAEAVPDNTSQSLIAPPLPPQDSDVSVTISTEPAHPVPEPNHPSESEIQTPLVETTFPVTPSSPDGAPSSASSSPSKSDLPPVPAGAWFVKKAENWGKDQKRFFSIKDKTITYFQKETNGVGADPKGEIKISSSTQVTCKSEVLMIHTTDRTWVLTAANAPISESWGRYLRALAQSMTIKATLGRLNEPSHSATTPLPVQNQTNTATPAYLNQTPSVELTPEEKKTKDFLNMAQRLVEKKFDEYGTPVTFKLIRQELVKSFSQEFYDEHEDEVMQLIDDKEAEEFKSHTLIPAWFWKKPQKSGSYQRRLFVFNGSRLNYFMGVSYEEDTPSGFKGSIPLSAASTISIQDSQNSKDALELVIHNPDRSWFLTAEDRSVAQAWHEELLQVTEKMRTGLKGGSDDEEGGFTNEEEMDLYPGQGIWFKKAGVGLGAFTGMKRRYFKIFYGLESRKIKFAYFKDLKGTLPVKRMGEITISRSSTISVDHTTRELIVLNPDRNWRLKAEDVDDAVKWADCLRNSFDKVPADPEATVHAPRDVINFNEIKQEKQDPVLARIVDIIKEHSTDSLPSYQQVKNAIVQEYDVETFYTHKDSVVSIMKDLELRMATARDSSLEAADLAGSFPPAWFTKKAEAVGKSKKRFFLLGKSGLRYYVDQHNGRPVIFKGEIPITEASVCRYHDSTLEIKNPDRTWVLVADNAKISENWFKEISSRISALSELDSSVVASMSAIEKYAKQLIEEDLAKISAAKAASPAPIPTTPSTSADQAASIPPPRTTPMTFAELRTLVIEKFGEEEFIRHENDLIVQIKERDLKDIEGETAYVTTLLKPTWFKKSAESVGLAKKRIFAFAGSEIRYYVGEENGRLVVLKGRIPVNSSTGVARDGCMLTISNDRNWKLTADDEGTAKLWFEELNKVISSLKPLPPSDPRVLRRFKELYLQMTKGTLKSKSRSTTNLSRSQSSTSLAASKAGSPTKSDSEHLKEDKGPSGDTMPPGEPSPDSPQVDTEPVEGALDSGEPNQTTPSIEGVQPDGAPLLVGESAQNPANDVPLSDATPISTQPEHIVPSEDIPMTETPEVAPEDNNPVEIDEEELEAELPADISEAAGSVIEEPDADNISKDVDLDTEEGNEEEDQDDADEDDVFANYRIIKDMLIEEFGEYEFKKCRREIVQFLVSKDLSLSTRSVYDGAVIHETGWFKKKAEKFGKDRRRYFVFNGKEIKYYLDEQNGKPVVLVGRIPVLPSTVIVKGTKKISIKNPDRTWVLLGESADVVKRWVDALQESIKPKETAFEHRLNQLILALDSAASSSMHGAVTLQALSFAPRDRKATHQPQAPYYEIRSVLMKEFGPEIFTRNHARVIEALRKRDLSLGAPALTLNDLTPAWFTKTAKKVGKDQRRYFVFAGDSINYYEGETDGVPVVLKGSIPVTPTTAFSSNDRTLIVSTPTRKYELVADSADIPSAWAEILNAHLKKSLIKSLTANMDSQEKKSFRGSHRSVDQDGGFDENDEMDEDDDDADTDFLDGQGAWFFKAAEKFGRKQKRYFKLMVGNPSSNLKFAYFQDFKNGLAVNRKGSIPLSRLSVINCEDDQLMIENPDRTWVLTPVVLEDASKWCQLLLSAWEKNQQAIAEREKNKSRESLHDSLSQVSLIDLDPAVVERINELANDPTIDSYADCKGAIIDEFGASAFKKHKEYLIRQLETRDEPVLDLPGQLFLRPAWFVKKAENAGRDKRRFFVFAGRYVEYYAGEHNSKGSVLKGKIVLDAKTSVTLSDKVITISSPSRNWVLTADSSAIAQEWASVLNTVVRESTIDVVDVSSESSSSEMDEDLYQHEGVWLRKQAEVVGRSKKRYFKLVRGIQSHKIKFSYFGSVEAGIASNKKGHVPILPETTVTVEDSQLLVKSNGRVWKLKAENPEDLNLWRDRIMKAVENVKSPQSASSSSILSVFEKARVLLTDSFEEFNTPDGFARLKQALIDGFDEQTFRNSRHSVAEMAQNRGLLVPYEVLEDLSIKPAWFIKKAERAGKDKKRYFVLRGKEIEYYESEKNGHPVGLKGSFPISSSTTISLSDATLTINNLDRPWILTAETSDVAYDWSLAIYDLIKLYEEEEGEDDGEVWDAEDEELDIIMPGQGVWLMKSAEKVGRKQRRYFALVYGSRSRKLKFNYFKDCVDGKPSGRAGSIVITQSSEIRCESSQLVIVTPERTWELTASSHDEAREWADNIKNAWKNVPQKIAPVLDMASSPVLVRLEELVNKIMEDNEADDLSPLELRAQLVQEFGEEAVQKNQESINLYLQGKVLDRQGMRSTLPPAWFIKKAENMGKDKRRYFVFTGRDIKYYVGEENGRPVEIKGSIPITPSTQVEREGRVLSISTPERKYILTADTDTIAQEWEHTLRNVTKQLYLTTLNSVQSASFLNQGNDASGGSESIFLYPAWFVKKASSVGDEKERYFVLKGREVTYYEGEQDGRPFNPKGSFQLNNKSTAKSYDIELEIDTQDRVWLLTARYSRDAKAWCEAINKVRAGAMVIPKLRPIDLDRTPEERDQLIAAEEAIVMKPSWFIKRDEEMETSIKAFFVFENNEIVWYTRAVGGTPKDMQGALPIRKCSSVQQPNPVTLRIHTTSLLKWTLIADSPEIAGIWAQSIKDSIPSSPDLELEHVQQLSQLQLNGELESDFTRERVASTAQPEQTRRTGSFASGLLSMVTNRTQSVGNRPGTQQPVHPQGSSANEREEKKKRRNCLGCVVS